MDEFSREGDSVVTEGAGGVLERNIHALLTRREQAESRKRTQDRIADLITGFTGSMLFVYIHVVMFGAWIVLNLGWLAVEPFDPTFVVLAMIASVEALFLSTFVLISQNRMAALADKRADLDLQVTLLTEHEVTRLVALVTEMAKRMNIDSSHDPQLLELAKHLSPEKVLDKMEKTERERGAAVR